MTIAPTPRDPNQPVIAVIGGSGLYDLDGLEGRREHALDTPFGAPSDAIIEGRLNGVRMLFLPRHGRGHRVNPSEINYRANIWALRALGATDVVSVSAVGSMREDLPPGMIVLVDSFIDRTVSRPRTFFEQGVVAHVQFADPISRRTQDAVAAAAARAGVELHRGGAYVCIEGPQFSTRAESALFRTWPDVAVIGMTNMPEARLAREAELAYCTMALVTDFDCWHQGHDDVSVEAVVAVMKQNVASARAVLRALTEAPPTAPCASHCALDFAVMTAPAAIPAAARARLGLFLDRVLDAAGAA
jgi:5'-methylthioadenosine phosphorylase